MAGAINQNDDMEDDQRDSGGALPPMPTDDSSGALSSIPATLMQQSQAQMPPRSDVLAKRQALDDAIQRLSETQSNLGYNLSAQTPKAAYAPLQAGLYKQSMVQPTADVERAKLGTGYSQQDTENALNFAKTGADTLTAQAALNLKMMQAGIPGGLYGQQGGNGSSNQPQSGFSPMPVDPMARKAQMAIDEAQEKAHEKNRPIYDKVEQDTQNMLPSLQNTRTGGLLGSQAGNIDAAISSVTPWGTPQLDQMAVQHQDIDTQGQNLAQDAVGLNSTGRGTNMQLKTILASKPSNNTVMPTNLSNAANVLGKVSDAKFEGDVFSNYRSAMGVTDPRMYDLEDALKQMYPSTITDPKTGAISYSSQNVIARRNAINDAIKNPQKYGINPSGGRLNNPAAQSATPLSSQMTTSSAQNTQPPPIQQATTPVKVSSPEEAEKLPSGTVFIDDKGVTRTRH